MNNESKHVNKPNQSQDTNHTVDKSKRSFAKVGVLAPVIMTLASRSALGGQVCAPSGFVSATTTTVSGSNHKEASCGGLSPGAYKTPYDGSGNWVHPYSPGGVSYAIHPEGFGNRSTPIASEEHKESYKNFESFGNKVTPIGTLMSEGFSYPNGYLADFTMYDVLWMTGVKDPVQLGAHLVAALLNAASGRYSAANGLTVTDVREMYAQLSISNTYSPASGVTWSATEVVDFLKQTMT